MCERYGITYILRRKGVVCSMLNTNIVGNVCLKYITYKNILIIDMLRIKERFVY